MLGLNLEKNHSYKCCGSVVCVIKVNLTCTPQKYLGKTEEFRFNVCVCWGGQIAFIEKRCSGMAR